MKSDSEYDRKWIIETSIPIIESYDEDLTIRALHYRLVAEGMTNDLQHYKKVVSAMTDARWDGLIRFDAFVDHERETLGATLYEETSPGESAESAKEQIKSWATDYSKNRWENQPVYPEVFIEKKALQGVFERPCNDWDVALNPCKGYPSLTFQYDVRRRMKEAISRDKTPIILYFGDYDCSGEDIPRSIQDTLGRMGEEVEVRRIALMKPQVVKWKLPPAPTKRSDSRAANWDGLGQVELDAVEPKKIVQLCNSAIESIFDPKLYRKLMIQQEEERAEFKRILKRDFKKLLD